MSVVCCQVHNHSLGKHIVSGLQYVATFDASWLLDLAPGFAQKNARFYHSIETIGSPRPSKNHHFSTVSTQ